MLEAAQNAIVEVADFESVAVTDLCGSPVEKRTFRAQLSDDGHGTFRANVQTAMSFAARRGRIRMRIILGDLISPASIAVVHDRFSARRGVDR